MHAADFWSCAFGGGGRNSVGGDEGIRRGVVMDIFRRVCISRKCEVQATKNVRALFRGRFTTLCSRTLFSCCERSRGWITVLVTFSSHLGLST